METGQEYQKARRRRNEWCLPAPSVLRKRIRCGFRSINAHVEQKRPELCRIGHRQVSTSPTTTVYVKELDVFVAVKLLEDTPAVLSLGKLCEDHGYSYEWTSVQKPQLIKDGRRKKCSTENYVPIVVLGLSTGSSSSATPTYPTGSSSSYIGIPHQQEVRVRVAQYRETRRMKQ